MDEPFILRGLCRHRSYQEEFGTLDEALDEFAWVRYRSMDVTDDGLTTWWPNEVLCPDGTVMDEDDLERLRPDPDDIEMVKRIASGIKADMILTSEEAAVLIHVGRKHSPAEIEALLHRLHDQLSRP